ncbi:MAG: hypothetical protein IKE46_00985 [Selenomonadaceae bacterium]|nr:hypothetical protein [Selenomonadaceae bacterium]
MTRWEVKADEEKVKALHVRILEECKRQGFTRHEFSRLRYLLEKSDSRRGGMLLNEPIIPPEGVQELL